LYLSTVLSSGVSSSESDLIPSVAGLFSSWVAQGSFPFTNSLSFAHTGSLTALGKHLSSLNLGFRAVATFDE
jgi:hypothetical protein